MDVFPSYKTSFQVGSLQIDLNLPDWANTLRHLLLKYDKYFSPSLNGTFIHL